MVDVFISYARTDRERVIPLAHELEEHGWTVWWDRQIPPGKTFDEVIEDALNEANTVIAVWTEAAIASQWVRTEAAEGSRRGILVPVLLDDVLIPLAFRRIQAANLVDWVPGVDHPGFNELVGALEALIASAAAAKTEPADPVERAVAGARARFEERDWEGALALLAAIETEPEENPELHAEARELRAMAERKRDASELFDEAEVLYADGRWSDVVARIDRVLELDPDSELGTDLRGLAERRIAEERERHLSREYERATAALAAREWSVAVALLEELIRAAPAYRDTDALLDQARTGATAERRYRQLGEMLRNGRWNDVVAGMTAFDAEYPGYGDTDGLLERARAEMAEAGATAEQSRQQIGGDAEVGDAGLSTADELGSDEGKPDDEPERARTGATVGEGTQTRTEALNLLRRDSTHETAPAKGDVSHGAPPAPGATDMWQRLMDRRWAIVGGVAAVVILIGVITAMSGDDDSAATGTTAATAAPEASAPGSTTGDSTPDDEAAPGTAVDLSGTTVEILTRETGEEAAGFELGLAQLVDRTGVDIVVSSDLDPSTLTIALEGGDPPDIALIPGPDDVIEFAAAGQAVALPDDIVVTLDTILDLGLIEAVTRDGQVYGVAVSAGTSNLVWYSPSRFADNGYDVPQSWNELVALQEQMKADGNVPWGFGIESGGASGWPFMHAMDDLVLTLHGPEIYDQLLRHDIRFTDQPVVEAAQTTVDTWLSDGNVLGGQSAVATTSWQDAGVCVADGSCMMHRQGDFYRRFLADAGLPPDEMGISVFRLPSAQPDQPNAGIGYGMFAVAFADRPEVMEVMRFLASADYADARIRTETGAFFSPNRAHDPNLHAAEIDRLLAQTLLDTEPFRFRVADRLPFVVVEVWWRGAMDLATGQTDVSGLVEAMEAAWP